VKGLFPSFFLWLGNATDRQLARQLQFFQAEKCFLPDKRPQHISVNAPKRQRLLSCGKPLGWSGESVDWVTAEREPSC
jgi:hypothetical protein